MQNIRRALGERRQEIRRRIGSIDSPLTADDSRSSERGAAATEFVLILPILLLIIAGIMGFGHCYIPSWRWRARPGRGRGTPWPP